jgi:hypothetical protein
MRSRRHSAISNRRSAKPRNSREPNIDTTNAARQVADDERKRESAASRQPQVSF